MRELTSVTTTSDRGFAPEVQVASLPITPAELFEIKKLLGWTSVRLASLLGTNYTPLQRFLSGRKLTRPFDPTSLRHALETAGVEFIEENGVRIGVRLRKP